jgi:hypothetical protein
MSPCVTPLIKWCGKGLCGSCPEAVVPLSHCQHLRVAVATSMLWSRSPSTLECWRAVTTLVTKHSCLLTGQYPPPSLMCQLIVCLACFYLKFECASCPKAFFVFAKAVVPLPQCQ